MGTSFVWVMQLPPRKTASQAWSSLPTIPSALLPQMKRDYQAMALRDSLDPKRFMKGKVKSTVPEHFAVSPPSARLVMVFFGW